MLMASQSTKKRRRNCDHISNKEENKIISSAKNSRVQLCQGKLELTKVNFIIEIKNQKITFLYN